MKRNLLFVFLLFSALYFVSCKKVKQGVQTTVKGYVLDTLKNKRLAGAKVVIYGCRIAGEMGKSCADSVAASVSNANGEVDFSFTANGKYIDYAADVRTDLSFYNQRVFDLNPGQENFIVFKALETIKIAYHLKVLRTSADKFFINSYEQIQRMPAKPYDTVLVCRAVPGQRGLITFQALYANKQIRGFQDFHQIGQNDTTLVKVVDHTDDLPIR